MCLFAAVDAQRPRPVTAERLPRSAQHVPPPLHSLTGRLADLLAHTPFYQGSSQHCLPAGIEPPDLVHLCVCWDTDCTVWRIECRAAHAERAGQDGRRPGPPRDSDDCKCKPGRDRGRHAKGKCHVRLRALGLTAED